MSCDEYLSKCKAECCRGFWILQPETFLYFKLHFPDAEMRVLNKKPVIWIPVVCSQLDTKTNRCKDYNHRPAECVNYHYFGAEKECKCPLAK